jgi:hypothetical protein
MSADASPGRRRSGSGDGDKIEIAPLKVVVSISRQHRNAPRSGVTPSG